VSEEDQVAVRQQSQEKALFQNLDERFKEMALPQWVTFDTQSMRGSILNRPAYESIEPQFDPTVVLEFYSR
jgi:ribosomal protein S4